MEDRMFPSPSSLPKQAKTLLLLQANVLLFRALAAEWWWRSTTLTCHVSYSYCMNLLLCTVPLIQCHLYSTTRSCSLSVSPMDREKLGKHCRSRQHLARVNDNLNDFHLARRLRLSLPPRDAPCPRCYNSNRMAGHA